VIADDERLGMGSFVRINGNYMYRREVKIKYQGENYKIN